MKLDLKNKYKVQVAREYFEKLIEKQAWVEIREIKMKRNLDQNALYWIWINAISKQAGRDKNELHFQYRALGLPKDDEYITGILKPELWTRIKPLIKEFRWFPGMDTIIEIISYSTADREVGQFAAYMSFVQKHARVHFDVILLTLDDKHFIDFYREMGFE
jgi:hypothetical protein